MKYLDKYKVFKEGKKYAFRKYIPPKWGENERLDVFDHVKDSPAMQDIIALMPVNTWTHEDQPYDVYKTHRITFSRNFGQRHIVEITDEGKFLFRAGDQLSWYTSENFEDLEDCLRHLWAYIVSRKVIFKITTNFSKTITYRLLSDPAKQMFWGERRTLSELYQLSQMLPKEAMDNVINQLNEAFKMVGLVFRPLNKAATKKIGEKYGVEMYNTLGITRNSILNILVKNSVNIDTAKYATDDFTQIIVLNKRKQDSSTYYIQPRTEEEAFVQICWKVSKIFKDFDNTLELPNKKKVVIPYIKLFVEQFAIELADAVEEEGFVAYDSEDKIYKLVYDGLINSKEPMKMLDILKKKTPELWAKLEELGGEKMNIGAEMGDLGFS